MENLPRLQQQPDGAQEQAEAQPDGGGQRDGQERLRGAAGLAADGQQRGRAGRMEQHQQAAAVQPLAVSRARNASSEERSVSEERLA